MLSHSLILHLNREQDEYLILFHLTFSSLLTCAPQCWQWIYTIWSRRHCTWWAGWVTHSWLSEIVRIVQCLWWSHPIGCPWSKLPLSDLRRALRAAADLPCFNQQRLELTKFYSSPSLHLVCTHRHTHRETHTQSAHALNWLFGHSEQFGRGA